ncbi:hypothetical protein Bbelb_154020 [Branchiostoma belcheri]|nr:hypothetical protein Bbelb_154020 [Branchiostoma belcheri]
MSRSWVLVVVFLGLLLGASCRPAPKKKFAVRGGERVSRDNFMGTGGKLKMGFRAGSWGAGELGPSQEGGSFGNSQDKAGGSLGESEGGSFGQHTGGGGFGPVPGGAGGGFRPVSNAYRTPNIGGEGEGKKYETFPGKGRGSFPGVFRGREDHGGIGKAYSGFGGPKSGGKLFKEDRELFGGGKGSGDESLGQGGLSLSGQIGKQDSRGVDKGQGGGSAKSGGRQLEDGRDVGNVVTGVKAGGIRWRSGNGDGTHTQYQHRARRHWRPPRWGRGRGHSGGYFGTWRTWRNGGHRTYGDAAGEYEAAQKVGDDGRRRRW